MATWPKPLFKPKTHRPRSAPTRRRSQSRQHGVSVGQIPLDPASMEVVDGGIEARDHARVRQSAGRGRGRRRQPCRRGQAQHLYLIDLTHFPTVNEIMATYFQQPYPARAAIGVAALPKGVGVEMDAVTGDRSESTVAMECAHWSPGSTPPLKRRPEGRGKARAPRPAGAARPAVSPAAALRGPLHHAGRFAATGTWPDRGRGVGGGCISTPSGRSRRVLAANWKTIPV